jgi:GNAT superfamily N-acetyltransferase
MTTKHATGDRRSGTIRVLTERERQLLQDHLLRLDPQSRRDRFNGVVEDEFLIKYAAGCFGEGVVVLGYIEDGQVHAAAELHAPQRSADETPEIAFSVERDLRRKGVGSALFKALIDEARKAGYPRLRVTTGAQNDAMRGLARKFGTKLTFRHGELSGSIALDTGRRPVAPAGIAMPFAAGGGMLQAIAGLSLAFWTSVLRLYGLAPTLSEPRRKPH